MRRPKAGDPIGPWYKVWPDVWAHRLERYLPSRVVIAACKWRGPHGVYTWVSAR